MVRTLGPLLGMVVLMLCIAHFAWATTDPNASNGQLSLQLSQKLYCQVTGLLEGYVGLLIGLVMLIAGFWTLINGGSVPTALSMIIMGGLVTALPSLINSTLNGTYALLQSAHLLGASTFAPPMCGNGTHQLDGGTYSSDGRNIYVTDPTGATTTFGM